MVAGLEEISKGDIFIDEKRVNDVRLQKNPSLLKIFLAGKPRIYYEVSTGRNTNGF